MEIPLSQAPELFFDQQQWVEFSAPFATRQNALAMIGLSPILRHVHVEGLPHLPISSEARILKPLLALSLILKSLPRNGWIRVNSSERIF